MGLASPRAREVLRKLVPSSLTAARFSPLQGKREDEAPDRSPEAEGGGEGSRDRAEEGPHRSDFASGVQATEGLAGWGGQGAGTVGTALGTFIRLGTLSSAHHSPRVLPSSLTFLLVPSGELSLRATAIHV